MISIEEYHENIRKIMHKDTILEALNELDKLPEQSKTLICMMAFNIKENGNGEITSELEIDDMENFFGFVEMKKKEGFFDKDVTPEELRILENLKNEKKE